MKEYALYKGEECLAIGTVKEIAKKMNLKEETVKFYKSPSYKKRTKGNGMVLVVIDDDKEDGDSN